MDVSLGKLSSQGAQQCRQQTDRAYPRPPAEALRSAVFLLATGPFALSGSDQLQIRLDRSGSQHALALTRTVIAMKLSNARSVHQQQKRPVNAALSIRQEKRGWTPTARRQRSEVNIKTGDHPAKFEPSSFNAMLNACRGCCLLQ
eukprot:scaffold2044_cov247-Pinguiococcus_pyrenoidosus.AAC.12